MDNKSVVVVSGLPRSGTSMMMKMLEAGGLPVLADGIRTADSDNPKGYYEFERVKQLPKGDDTWLPDAQGKVVKVISALLTHLPAAYGYRVIFMQRRMEEILRSQQKMLVNREEMTDQASDEELSFLFQKHLLKAESWLLEQPNIALHYVDYNQMLIEPTDFVPQLNAFLDNALDENAMLQVVDPTLYRNRV